MTNVTSLPVLRKDEDPTPVLVLIYTIHEPNPIARIPPNPPARLAAEKNKATPIMDFVVLFAAVELI